MDQSINQLVTHSLYESVSQSFTYSLTITNNQLIIIIIIIIIIIMVIVIIIIITIIINFI